MTELIAFFPPTRGTIKPMATSTMKEAAPTVTETVTVEVVPSRSDLTMAETEWGWSELRDYVVSQIIERFGPFPRDARKEYGIFSRFLNQHGVEGIRVAKAAFEVYDGWWNGAPISVNRFTKGSDPYFVGPILERLAS